MKKNENGITLIILIVTVIVLLILTSVSIHLITSSDLSAKARESTNKTQEVIDNHENWTNSIITRYENLQ